MNAQKEKQSWEDDIERLVLFADIMGFKDRVTRTAHNTLKHELENFKTEWQKKMSPFKLGDYLRFSQYSDSIVIVVNGVDSRCLNLITKAAVCLMQNSLQAGFPIKGAIAKGIFTYNEDLQLFFGQPLIDAYLLQDEIKYYGIVAHHTIEHMIKISKLEISRLYSEVEIPLEKWWSKHYILCWHRLKNNNYYEEGINWRPWLEKIEEQVSGKPRIYIDNTIKVMNKFLMDSDSK